ncbi:MAG: hypothetical protein WC712_11080 [Candidatus Brocadiia bacterium]
MAFNLSLPLLTDAEAFTCEDPVEVEQKARDTGRAVYSWQCSGRENWLARGFQRTDVIAWVLLPDGLPEVIDLEDDEACG